MVSLRYRSVAGLANGSNILTPQQGTHGTLLHGPAFGLKSLAGSQKISLPPTTTYAMVTNGGRSSSHAPEISA